jgi:hypothetical protein
LKTAKLGSDLDHRNVVWRNALVED